VAIGLRPFCRTGLSLTQVGLGSGGILRTQGRSAEAVPVIEEAALQGVNYFDSIRAYTGSEGYYGEFWEKHPDLRRKIFQACKSSAKDKTRAHTDLIYSMTYLGLDYLDLWQIHDVRTWKDVERIEEPGGALEAFQEAKDTGMTRHIGVTGQFNPKILEYCVARWPVDSVQMPVNPLEAIPGGFIDIVQPAAENRGLTILGMKVLGGSHHIPFKGSITPEILVRFALNQRICVAVVSCSTPAEVDALARMGEGHVEMSPEEEKALVEAFRPYVGNLAYYRGYNLTADTFRVIPKGYERPPEALMVLRDSDS